ncbi:MAG: hypothetical protein IMZ62_14170 [Chloroflexi bacterium]|nr:hypothetical protein [Chloroflexota bacterium]
MNKQYEVTAKQVATYPGYEIGETFFVIGVPQLIDETQRSHAAFDDPRMFDVVEVATIPEPEPQEPAELTPEQPQIEAEAASEPETVSVAVPEAVKPAKRTRRPNKKR